MLCASQGLDTQSKTCSMLFAISKDQVLPTCLPANTLLVLVLVVLVFLLPLQWLLV